MFDHYLPAEVSCCISAVQKIGGMAVGVRTWHEYCRYESRRITVDDGIVERSFDTALLSELVIRGSIPQLGLGHLFLLAVALVAHCDAHRSPVPRQKY